MKTSSVKNSINKSKVSESVITKKNKKIELLIEKNKILEEKNKKLREENIEIKKFNKALTSVNSRLEFLLRKTLLG